MDAIQGQLRQQAYSHLASGANSVMYWHWHSIHNTLWHHNFPCGLSKPKKEACLFFQTRFFFCMLFYILFYFVSFFTELPSNASSRSSMISSMFSVPMERRMVFGLIP